MNNIKIKVDSITTKFGTAKISNNGYWKITSCKEGNHGKLWHRLIWEDFYGTEVPEGYHIHHKNGKLDNCILNLQLMHKSAHMSLHHKSKKVSNTTKQKMSESHKGKKFSDEHKQKISESHKGKNLSDEHKQKISESLTGRNNPMWNKHHSWETKQKISESHKGKTHSDEAKKKMSESCNTSGYFRVGKKKDNHYKQGFFWRYRYYDGDGNQKEITCVDIEKLEKKVKETGLPWLVLNEEE